MDEEDISNKNVIITGANCGIGFETALDLAKRGARVIIACRDEAKAKDAVDRIKQESQNDKIECELLNLANLKSIKEFSDRILTKLERLDILINNAGVAVLPYQKTDDEFEAQFGINHLGHFYLTNLLLELIKSSAPSRIINVSSTGHKGVNLDWNNLQSEGSYNPLLVYRRSKLANVLFTVELADRLKDTGVAVVCLHPGTVRSEIWNREKPLFMRIFMPLIKPFLYFFAIDCKEGAKTSIYCAVSKQISNHSGAYFENCKISQMSLDAQDRNNAKKLWSISQNLVQLKN